MSEKLFCSLCGKRHKITTKKWRCDCGGFFNIELKAEFPIEKIKNRPANMWRYREALPEISDENIISMGEGFTPLVCFEEFGKNVFIKQEHLFPSGSYKDRGASMMISKVKQLGIKSIVEDSSGNAGSAVAAYAANANIDCEIFVPETTSHGKLVQIESYGAHLKMIPGNRESTTLAAMKAAEGTYYASHCYNPYFFQGTKTFAYEIVEQFNWKAPDTVILPVGNGTLLLGSYIGFYDLFNSGIIDAIPRIIGVQAENCSPLAKIFHCEFIELQDVEVLNTMAEGIAISKPLRWKEIISAVRKTGGVFVTVKESEIFDALKTAFRNGYFIEPTSAAVVAGLKKYLEKHKDKGVIVSAFTGHGLKASDKIFSLFNKFEN